MELNELSTSELKALLAQREKDEKSLLQKEQQQYVAERDSRIETLMSKGKELQQVISEFKAEVHTAMEEQATKLSNYGKLNGKSKGGFSISNTASNYRITRRRDTEPTWDERALKGVELIKEFMASVVKKRDVKLYEILLKFLEKNEAGDLEYAKVFGLMEHEDKFEDPRWKEGLRLLKQSYSISLKCFGYEFKEKNEAGKWESLVLNFSSL